MPPSQGADLAAAAAVNLEEEDLHWSADVMAVRCVEKMLDVLAGGAGHGTRRGRKGRGNACRERVGGRLLPGTSRELQF